MLIWETQPYRGVERDPIPYALETAWGGWIRTSAFQNRNSPRLSAWAAGFEPLHIEIIETADLDRQLVASGCSVAVLHHSRCGSSTPAAPTGRSVSNAYGIGSCSKWHEMAAFRSIAPQKTSSAKVP